MEGFYLLKPDMLRDKETIKYYLEYVNSNKYISMQNFYVIDDWITLSKILYEPDSNNLLINELKKIRKQLLATIKGYDIFHKPIIPSIPHDKIPEFHIKNTFNKYYDSYPYFAYYAISDKRKLQEKYFFYQIECGLQEKVVNRGKDVETYIARLDEEWKELKIISEELNTSMASYYSTMSKIIDLIWEAGSLAMPARGSAAGFLTCYLLEVTQIDPVPLGDYFPSWRHLNHQRGVELPD